MDTKETQFFIANSQEHIVFRPLMMGSLKDMNRILSELPLQPIDLCVLQMRQDLKRQQRDMMIGLDINLN